MPIIDYIRDPFTEIATWQVTESEEELRQYVNLTPNRTTRLEQMRPKQRMEYLGLRACMMELNADVDILYNDKGKPYIQQPKHLSITHSYGLVSVGISQYHIGVDIEKKRDKKILNIAEKFVREDEKEWLPKDERLTDYLHIIWGIKEGLYKINGGNLWNFLHHYRVEPFDLKPKEIISCWITDEKNSRKYFAQFKRIEEYYLVWVLDYKV